MAFLHHIGTFLIFAAMVLMIIVSVSTPIWRSVYFLKANLGAGGSIIAQQSFRMGNWGSCFGDMCTKSRLGYNQSQLSQLAGNNSSTLLTSALRRISYALILNPIAAGLAFLALLVALFPFLITGILASLLSFFAFLVCLAALAFDLGLFLTIRSRLNKIDGVNAELGNAMWFVVAATGALLLASFTVCFTHRSNKRNRRDSRTDLEEKPLTSQGQRNWFGRKNRNLNYDESTTNTATGLPPMHESTQHHHSQVPFNNQTPNQTY